MAGVQFRSAAGKADLLKRPLGELFSREIALLRRFLGVFRRKKGSESPAVSSKASRPRSAEPSARPSASTQSPDPSSKGPEPRSHRPRTVSKRKSRSGVQESAPKNATSGAVRPKGPRRQPAKGIPSPRQRKRSTPANGVRRIAPVRSELLDREIAHSPADPFASTVGSVVFHLVLLLIMIPLWTPAPSPDPPPSRVIIRYLPRENPEPEGEKEKEATPEAPTVETRQEEPEPVETPLTDEVNPEIRDTSQNSPVDDSQFTVDAEGGDFSTGRTGGGRTRALSLHGGSAETESAIQSGIEWLIRHQDRDGSWSPDRFHLHCEESAVDCEGAGYPEHRAGITGLCLLALLGNGHPPGVDGSPREVAAWKALRWLIDHQDPTGCIRSGKGDFPRNLYDHGIATFALCEAVELLNNSEVKKAAGKGLEFIASSQQPGGGWDYVPSPTLRNDLSITGWQVLALHAGRKIGLLPPPQVVHKLERYLQRCIDPAGGATYSDRGRGRGRGGYGIDAVGLLTRLTLGHSPFSRESIHCSKVLLQNLPAPDSRSDWDRDPQSMYYWYTATLALFHMGGPAWEKWNSAIQQHVLPLQHTEGELKGSWDPDPNWIGKAGGRVTQTALGILTFETYFRYTPLHRQLGFRR